MTDGAKLREDHAELVRITRALGEMIGRPTPPPQLELFDVRRRLSSTLIAHLKSEDWVLYPRLAASSDPEIAATGRAFNEEMGGLAAAFTAYVHNWSAAEIEADWPGYCAETRGIIDALMNRITRENRELLPLLDRIDQAA
jgi:hypothetical protein